ncbi:MAG: hypothetical protein JSR86_06285 [Proteobacteria bacterium]|nr:hypothetical protein [Pseudomonadota bacterium]
MLPWRKLGLWVEAPGGLLGASHAMVPTPLVLEDRVRVFYAACDADMRGRVFFADIEHDPPHRVIGRSAGPVMDVGAPGTFDADGVNPLQVFADGDGLALLYVGWRRGPAETPYTLLTGLARSRDGGLSFQGEREPLLAPAPGERLFRTAASISPAADGWRMIYVGGDAFIDDAAGKRSPLYGLRELRSADRLAWPGGGRELLAPDRAAGQTGFGRPVVWTPGGGAPVLMVSIRTEAGYTLVETPLDALEAGRPAFKPVLAGPADPWEAEMTCFGAPCVVGERELLFYNGNGFGRTGFGLAWRPRA